MESNRDIESINLAVQKLIQKMQSNGDDFLEDDEAQLLLYRLHSQVESLKGDEKQNHPEEPPIDQEEKNSLTEDKAEAKNNENAGKVDFGKDKITMEELAKELRDVKNQNSKTHWLLSVMIVLTLVWQVSEVSLLLILKDGLSHPFRCFGKMLVGMLRVPATSPEDVEKVNNHIVSPHLDIPCLKMPDLPYIELPCIGLSSEKN